MKFEGIWIIDAEGRTVYANDHMAEILGTTIAALRGTDSFSFVFPEDLPAARHLFSLKEGGSPAPFAFRLKREDGNCVWVEVQGTPLRNADGRFTGIVGTFTVADAPDVKASTDGSRQNARYPASGSGRRTAH